MTNDDSIIEQNYVMTNKRTESKHKF